MIALDADDFPAAEAHARVALGIYDRLQDPWGQLETKLILAQVALAQRDDVAEALVVACDEIIPEEAEPRQHRHLTRAWLAQQQERWTDAAAEIDAARAAYFTNSSDDRAGTTESAQTGDHTPHLLLRLARLAWSGTGLSKIESWIRQIEAAGGRPFGGPAPVRAT
jgi:hypothetical protein